LLKVDHDSAKFSIIQKVAEFSIPDFQHIAEPKIASKLIIFKIFYQPTTPRPRDDNQRGGMTFWTQLFIGVTEYNNQTLYLVLFFNADKMVQKQFIFVAEMVPQSFIFVESFECYHFGENGNVKFFSFYIKFRILNLSFLARLIQQFSKIQQHSANR